MEEPPLGREKTKTEQGKDRDDPWVPPCGARVFCGLFYCPAAGGQHKNRCLPHVRLI